MAQQPVSLDATARERVGKGAARQARREGNIPAVIYGAKKAPLSISVNANELWKQYLKGHFTSTVFEIKVGSDTHRVIARDLQLDPVRDTPVHADFLRIAEDGIIRINVPVRFVNDTLSPGLKRGGVLNIVRHEVEVFCPYDHIPSFFEIDLEGMQIGKSIHISSVNMPEGVKPTISDRDFTIATIAGRIKDDDAGEAAAAAPAADAKAAPKAGGDAKGGAKPAAAAPAAKAPAKK
ncbi:MAG: 50S ribosomal protein L25/general stress protein Ctc [Hyphomicrobiaceae bacterium]